MTQAQPGTITTLQVDGITCSGCVSTLTRVLKDLPGVEDVSIDPESGRTQVRHDAGQVNGMHFREAIEDAGYDVE